tara:strand:+ start:6341 stop:7210 length:870 start_codon:yes stop_codon:yes gene_type:complete
MSYVKINNRKIGQNEPTYIIAEIGLNHNGDIEIAKKLIESAKNAGCDAVKFQKRTPELCVPIEQRNIMRETPWGTMSYMDYRYKVEFGYDEYTEIDTFCKEKKIDWFASCWDEKSVDFIEKFDPICYKIASACITDMDLLKKHVDTNKPIIMSTGMSTMEQIKNAVEVLGTDNLLIAHCTSSYPCPVEDLNLNMIKTLKKKFNCPIGYSGHEVGLNTTVASVVLGATFIERHITLDRSMWGSDQSASVEPQGLIKLVRDIHSVNNSLGDGIKKIYDREKSLIDKLRRHK